MKAVSELEAIRLGDAEVAQLRDLLEWATVSNDEVHIKQHGDEVDAERKETKEKFTDYFERTGMHAFYAVPLLDDAGRIGILSFESRDPDFLTDAHVEMIRVLASQVTVALRNAELYKEVPFIGVIEPRHHLRYDRIGKSLGEDTDGRRACIELRPEMAGPTVLEAPCSERFPHPVWGSAILFGVICQCE